MLQNLQQQLENEMTLTSTKSNQINARTRIQLKENSEVWLTTSTESHESRNKRKQIGGLESINDSIVSWMLSSQENKNINNASFLFSNLSALWYATQTESYFNSQQILTIKSQSQNSSFHSVKSTLSFDRQNSPYLKKNTDFQDLKTLQ